eukprot:CAMPEP_0182583266 /NCGR_PEP_ID=MMETSP1324-20130603/54652_1 /TAXON_ID=236786 /ORGANISM="Florenciella sp., Strain RCC1587" /LENGTH=78 /DNA_ID=CAMNT_0024799811 /DNA_START=348 /DNA_END=581 /DNA_ORIENTATION=+
MTFLPPAAAPFAPAAAGAAGPDVATLASPSPSPAPSFFLFFRASRLSSSSSRLACRSAACSFSRRFAPLDFRWAFFSF